MRLAPARPEGATRRQWIAAAAGTVLAGAGAPARAGADPQLVERARREGPITLYASMAEKDLRLLVESFTALYGVEVSVWRSGKNKVLQRALTEGRAGRRVVDVVHNPSPEMEALYREGGLQPVRSPVHDSLLALALPAHREWAGLRVYLFVAAYNTDKVRADELPRSWEDLLHPRWRGRLGIEAKEQEWFATLVKTLGEARGIKLLRDIASGNGLSVRNGHALLNNMVVSGEVPLVLTTYSYLPEQARRRGAPVNWFVLPPAIAYTDGVGIARQAPHPAGARLFYDFMLSDAQTQLAQMAHITTQRSSEAFLRTLQPVYIDPAAVLDDYDKWTTTYEATIAGRVAG